MKGWGAGGHELHIKLFKPGVWVARVTYFHGDDVMLYTKLSFQYSDMCIHLHFKGIKDIR